MTLLARQRAFGDYLRDLPNDITPQIAGDAAARLAVYHNAFRARLGDCLRDFFAKSWAYLGDEHFASAIEAHRLRCEPHSWTLDAYGAGFDETLATLFPDDAEIAELAWLEWALRRAFDGADAHPLAQDDLAGIDWDKSVPLLHPTMRMREAEWNSAAVWAAIDKEVVPPAADTLKESTLLLVWRKGLVPQYRSATGYERDALLSIAEGNTFGAMCTNVFADLSADETVPIIGALFGGWVNDGLIVGASLAAAR
jgi:hypothetical protein